MRAFSCHVCDQRIYFDNVRCERMPRPNSAYLPRLDRRARVETCDHVPAGHVERHEVRDRLAAGEQPEFMAELGGDLVPGGAAAEVARRSPAQLRRRPVGPRSDAVKELGGGFG